MTDPAESKSGRPVQVAFRCESCGARAATIAVAPQGVAFAGEPPLSAGAAQALFSSPRLAVLDFLGNRAWPVSTETGDRVIAALRQDPPNAELIGAVNREYAPFFCTRCSLSYCETHWSVQRVFDERGYDYSDGTCPQGHRARVDEH